MVPYTKKAAVDARPLISSKIANVGYDASGTGLCSPACFAWSINIFQVLSIVPIHIVTLWY